ncbi:MAG: hypothetical protein ABGY71_00865 [bacterium]|nr:hypothetical protein [Planctomycetota bacterium]HIL53365.1 hypothetical protein [Planctomycetota bacterium]
MRSSGPPEGSRPWTLLLGPGERLDYAELAFSAALLKTTGFHHPDGAYPDNTEQLGDLDELLCKVHVSGRILLDVDAISREQVGFVRYFLERNPHCEVHLLGDDAHATVARLLRAMCANRWWQAPLQFDCISNLVAPYATTEPPQDLDSDEDDLGKDDLKDDLSDEVDEALPDTARPEPRPPEDAKLLERIEAILDGSGEYQPAPPAPAESAAPEPVEQLAAQEQQASTTGGIAIPPAPYFKNQIADLADLIQRLDFALASLSDENMGALAREKHQALAIEFASLKQFTRTLACLAAPPPRGSQLFDLEPMLEELLKARRAEPAAPRYLLRSTGDLSVRSDKALLAQVFDALLFLCHHFAGEDGRVRMDARQRPGQEAAGGEVHISICFSASGFLDLKPSEVLTPYALRHLMPELGANALAAARGILNGQGGSLELKTREDEGFEWIVSLPHAD